MKRSLKLVGLDKELELGRVNTIRKLQSEKEFIYIEKIDKGKDIGKWRMTYTEETIEDIKDLESIEIVRDDS